METENARPASMQSQYPHSKEAPDDGVVDIPCQGPASRRQMTNQTKKRKLRGLPSPPARLRAVSVDKKDGSVSNFQRGSDTGNGAQASQKASSSSLGKPAVSSSLIRNDADRNGGPFYKVRNEINDDTENSRTPDPRAPEISSLQVLAGAAAAKELEQEEDKKVRQKKLNRIYSRRKRYKQKSREESLFTQHDDLSEENHNLREENRRLQELLERAECLVASYHCGVASRLSSSQDLRGPRLDSRFLLHFRPPWHPSVLVGAGASGSELLLPQNTTLLATTRSSSGMVMPVPNPAYHSSIAFLQPAALIPRVPTGCPGMPYNSTTYHTTPSINLAVPCFSNRNLTL